MSQKETSKQKASWQNSLDKLQKHKNCTMCGEENVILSAIVKCINPTCGLIERVGITTLQDLEA